MKLIKYDDIKTPTTVEEFRTNLKTYYVCVGDDNWENRNKLYSQYHLDGWNIDSLDSLSDLYRLEMTRKHTQTPRISPYINFDMKKLTNTEIMTHWGSKNFEDVMYDKSRFKIYKIKTENQHNAFIDSCDPKWYGIDNQFLRSFYVKTLGDFSGYKVSKLSEVA